MFNGEHFSSQVVFISSTGMVTLNNPLISMLSAQHQINLLFFLMKRCHVLCNQNHQQVPNNFDEKGHVYYRLIQLKILKITGDPTQKQRHRSRLKYSDLRATHQSFTPEMTGHIPGRGHLLPGHLLSRLQLPKESRSKKAALAHTQSDTDNR